MAKIYRKRGNKLNEVVTFDSACTRQENQPLVYDATDGSVHTTTHIGCLNADDVSVGNLTVTGQAIIQEQVTDTIDSNTLVLRSNADAGLTGTENSGVIIHNYNGSEDLYAVTDNTGTFRVGTAVSTTTTYAYLRYNEANNKWYSTAPGVTPAVEVTPVGSPTSWDSVVTSGDDVEYTNIVFSVIDRTSLQPLTTRDESTNMEAGYLTKWNSTNEKVVTTGTSCTHDLCANGDITSTGDITADGNVCVKTNLTVDGNSCVSGDSTVSGEIHSCKCITAPTACVSDDLYVAGDINNCNKDSITHGYYGCFENNVCIKGDLAIDGVATLPGLVSDCVASVENTTNSSFYLPFVEENHLVKGANDLYTNGDLQYNPSTDVLCTKTFCSDRGIVQSAISGVTAADLGLTAKTAYSLSTIVSCLQACCGNKAVSYTFKYENASNPNVLEYGGAAYNLTFEKLDNNDLSGTWSKSRWLVTGENGVSWTVVGNTGATAGAITWSVCEHVVDQVCVATASNNQNYPLILSDYQSTPSCSKKTLFTDTTNNLMYNPSTNTLKTECVCACCDSYHARIASPVAHVCYATITLDPVSLGENTAHLTFDVYGIKFELGVKEIASNSAKMSITYFTKTGDYGITSANVIDAKNKNVVYIKYTGYRPINITSDIPIKSITTSSTVPSDVSSTSWCAPTYDNATQYVNVTNTNGDFPILFNNCQATPAAGCKTVYNDSANNLMYNPSTNTLTTCCICVKTRITEGNPTKCTSSVAGQPGSILQSGALKLYSCTPAVDFHAKSARDDYSHRVIACDNCLRIIASDATGSTFATNSACYDFCSDGTFCAPKVCGSFYSDCVTLGYTPNYASPVWFKIGCIRPTSSLSTQHLDLFVGGSGIIDTISLDLVDAVANKPIWKISHPYGYSDTNRFTCLCLTGETSSWICPVTLWAQVAPYRANERFEVSVYNRNITKAWNTDLQRVSSPTGNGLLSSALCINNTETSGCYKADYIYACRFTESDPVGCTASVTGKNGSILQSGVLDLYSATPAIDFHHNNYSGDYSHRIIGLNGGLRIQATDGTGSSTVTKASNFDFKYDGTLIATTFCGNVTATYLQVCDMTIASSTSTPISLTCGSYKARIDNYDNIVIGCNTSTSGSGNIAIGKTVCASSYGVALGNKAYADARSFAVGSSACACAEDTIAIGTTAKAHSINSIAIGCGSIAAGDGAVSIGSNASAHIGFLALGKCATSDVAIDTTTAGNHMFPYSSIIEMDNIKYGRHGRIKFVIPSCSKNIDITSFFNSLFISEINRGRCKNTWSTSSFENIPTLVAHLSGFYWDDGGSSDSYQRWAPGINGRGNINELILLNTSAAASSNLSVYDLIVKCGKNICTTSWNWGKGTNVWSCGMVGTIEF